MQSRGFTLVEMLVAIAVFSIVLVIGVGGFVRVLHTQGEIAALIAAQSNASESLEQITREIRTGYLFCDASGESPAVPNTLCFPHCAVNGTTWTCTDFLDFYNASGQEVDYERNPVDGALERSDSGSNGFSPITGSNVSVTYLAFTIFGNTEGDNWPPRITIAMTVAPSSTDPAIASDVLNLQTTVSARSIDCTQNSPIKC